MTETPLSNPYAEIFLRQVIRGIRLATDKVRISVTLDDCHRDHALTVADLGLQHSDAWPFTRELLLLLAPVMEQDGWREEWINFLERGVEQASELGDLEALGEYHFQLGVLFQLLADYDTTATHYRESALAFSRLQDPEREGRTYNRWAYAALNNTIRIDLALELVERAEALVQSAMERGYACMVRGTVAIRQNDAVRSYDWYSQSLHHWQTANNPRYIAWGLSNVGLAHLELRQYDDAADILHEALEKFEGINDPAYKAVALLNLGAAYYNLQLPSEALSYYHAAMPLFRQSNKGRSLAVLYNAIGMSYAALQQWELADEAYHLSMTGFREIHDITQIANLSSNIAEMYTFQGMHDRAKRILLDALYLLDTNQQIPGFQYFRDMITTDLSKVPDQS